jgi:hypothetical protein
VCFINHVISQHVSFIIILNVSYYQYFQRIRWISVIVAFLFVTMVTIFRSLCLVATKGHTYKHTLIQSRRLMAGLRVYFWDGVRCCEIYNKFHRDWFRRSEVNQWIHRRKDMKTHREHCSRLSLILFFQCTKRRIKMGTNAWIVHVRKVIYWSETCICETLLIPLQQV